MIDINKIKKLDFHEEINKYISLILSGTPFCLYRYGDGEASLSQGLPIDTNSQAYKLDKWTAPNKLTKLGLDIREPLKNEIKPFHFGIPCSCCNPIVRDYYLSKLNNKNNITYANLWINSNHSKFINFIKSYKKSYAIITNHNSNIRNLPNFPSDVLFVPDDCVNYWEQNRIPALAVIRNFSKTISNKLVLIAAGPLSEYIIFVMWNTNPTNQYIDIGSALDIYLKKEKNSRPYENSTSPYHQLKCHF